MIFTTSDGVRLNIVESGRDSGPTVVMLHGWVMDHRSWDDVAERLGGMRVLRVDWRGHGGSDAAPKGTATIDRLADDLAEVIAQVVAGPVVLAGHSLGGMTMMALAERHPRLVADRVVGAAFVATTGGGLAELDFLLPKWLAAPILFVESMANPVIERLPQRRLLGRLSLLGWPLVRFLAFGRRPGRGRVMAAARQLGQCSPAAMVGFRRELTRHERLVAMRVYRDIPAVVLAGDRDRLCTVAHARAIDAELADSVLEVYPGAGHMLAYERAEQVAEQLTRLVAGIPRQATA